jgi:glycine cleavage system H protein
MTVLLVILTFTTFIALDYALTRRKARQEAVGLAQALAAEPASPEPVWVAGYQLPEALHYHRGHTWDTAVVGIDDFARRLIGPAKALASPAIGDWVQQGEKAFAVKVDGREANFVSPIEGEVLAVNPDLGREPALATNDPYGRGWVMKVRARNLGLSLRNLLSGSLARRWTEDAREGLELRLMALSGSVLQDGGEPVADFARHLPTGEWKRLVGEFLLT